MPLTPGNRFGRYEILAPLGAGGMGEVYLARDARLERTVAIKVLAAAITGDRDARVRLEREARAISALNHPNICTLHDVGHEAETDFLVMEHVEGETLAARIARGRLDPRETTRIAIQIAAALEAAHGAGIIHRDLKPANIKITPAAQVKVLDFGLAKRGAALASAATATSPTFTGGFESAAGVILGTASYMSPEQARGGPVDKRTDIWAFGCVCYEMLTGTPAFPGATVTDVLAAVIHNEPDWTLLPDSTPTNVRRILRRCLAKDTELRARDMGDVRLDLAETVDEPSAPRSVRNWRLVGGLVAGSVVLIGAGALATWGSCVGAAGSSSPVFDLDFFSHSSDCRHERRSGALGRRHQAGVLCHRSLGAPTLRAPPR